VLIERTAEVHRRAPDGSVALTFDDGPQPGSTDVILDILADLNVRATFFCVGQNALAHPELVQRMLAEGHAVGSHSLTHPNPAETTITKLSRDYVDGQSAVAEAGGREPTLFRPPHGHLGLASAALVRRCGLQTWLWTVDPFDWRPGARTEQIAAVAGGARSGDVVLLHDWVEQPWEASALDRSATVEALPVVVDRIRRSGLRLETARP
jgi:peptidoglycan/xylan/chitin deacetylase (PgdA/CDA1 family)